MQERTVRLRIPEEIYRRFKVVCAEKNLSMPKQTAELIRQFVEVLEINVNLTKHLE